jgi:hypothetical protein
VDGGVLGVLDGFPGGVDVGEAGACQPQDGQALDLFRDSPNGVQVARRGGREAGLDNVDPQPLELAGDLDLLLGVHRRARRLLAVAQGGVEYDNALGHAGISLCVVSQDSWDQPSLAVHERKATVSSWPQDGAC